MQNVLIVHLYQSEDLWYIGLATICTFISAGGKLAMASLMGSIFDILLLQDGQVTDILKLWTLVQQPMICTPFVSFRVIITKEELIRHPFTNIFCRVLLRTNEPIGMVAIMMVVRFFSVFLLNCHVVDH